MYKVADIYPLNFVIIFRMSLSYNGPQLPVYEISITVPRVPVDNSAPPRRVVPQPRAVPPTAFLKPSAALNETRVNFENYVKMCEGIKYLEAKEKEPFPQ